MVPTRFAHSFFRSFLPISSSFSQSWNMEELADYAKLIKLGKPTLIEIKAVTFCGTSDASSLTMKNVPWHREVRRVCFSVE
jgi:wyosine [tRNA(Phe)-imidazoG37] synthetase (radical SAM superfamily)